MPSGTMGNQIGLRLVCEPGQEVLCDADAHVVTYEMGAAAAIFGISTRTWSSAGGRLDADQLIAQVRPKTDWHLTATAAIAVENTHNRGGGLVQPLRRAAEALRAGRASAGVAVHLDGARIWNAHVASGVAAVDLRPAGRHRVGLPLQGPRARRSARCWSPRAERIATARLWRKRLGGGMRQVGVLAAAGRYALRPPPRAARPRTTSTRSCWPSGSASTRRRSRPTWWCWTTSPRRSSPRPPRPRACWSARSARAGSGWYCTSTSTGAGVDRAADVLSGLLDR